MVWLAGSGVRPASLAGRALLEALELVNDAFDRDINITVGAYPWGAASTVIGAAMFTGEGWQERMGSKASNFQLGTERMTEEQVEDYQKNQPGTFIVWHFLDESNPEDLALLDKSILHPRVLIESDEMFWMFMDDHDRIINYAGDAWPLPEGTFSHPRSNGTFAKVLRSYVRERKLMSMQEALRKMTLMPAQTLEGFVPQMKQKGRLQEGMDAGEIRSDLDPDAGRHVRRAQPHRALVVARIVEGPQRQARQQQHQRELDEHVV